MSDNLNISRPISRLNAVRIFVVLAIAFGYSSTMPIGPGNPEAAAHLGLDPSWLGIQVLFFFSGFLALRSLRRHGSSFLFLRSRAVRNLPLLAIFTLIAVIIIYPALGVMPESKGDLMGKLAGYFFDTVLCLNPGRVLPGLLDDALYMCLIQGAIWTFRWGALLYIGVAVGAKFGVFRNNRAVLALAVLAMMTYAAVSFIQAKGGLGVINLSEPNLPNALLEKLVLASRLSWPFLAGMTYFAYSDKLSASFPVKMCVLAALGGAAVLWYYVLPWTPAIELLLTGFWIYAAMLLAFSRTPKLKILDNWPNLALGLYLANWPTAQLILLAWPELGSWGLIAASLAVTIAIAVAAHWVMSRPVIGRRGLSLDQDKLSRPPALSQ